MDHKESSKRSSKRPSSSRPDAGREREPDRPPAKKQALPQQPSSAEDIRSAVRGLYQAYQALVDAEGPSEAAFQALLKATAAGDLASRRLAARLVPRFLAHHPEHSEPAAAALIRLHCQQQAADPSCKSLEDLSRQDALAGLGAVLKAARACRAPHGEAAVKLVLDHLFRLLPAAASEEPSEPEEEGEVAPSDGSSASLGFLKRTLGEALSLHPAATMAYCSACLAAAAACRGNSSSSSSRDCPDPQVTNGVQLWLRDHLLKERSPSRECTPTAAAAAAAAAKAGDALAAGTAAAAAAAARNGCLLQAVLLGSEELQGWVMRQARSRATAPPEVRSVIESALQLLPEDKQLEALRPRPDTYHATPGAAAAAAANCSRGTPQQQQQQQRLKSSGSLPHYSRQQQNGGLVNGAEPLSRSLSTPGQLERDRSRAGGSKLGAPEPRTQQQQQQQFPQPPGPICRAEPCLLVLGLPPHISRQELQQTLGAEDSWLAPQQQQQQAGGRGLGSSSSSSSSSACCTFKGVLEAAKAYLRHNGMQRLPHCPPLRLAFCDCLPPGSAKAAAVAAAGSAQAPGYVWATRDAVGDAESITDELRAAGLSLNHVHRVNNAAEPGTLLQTPSAAHAASVVSYLLKKHPQQQQQQQQGEQEMPPLPPEPPPAADWARQQQQQQKAVPPLPPGPPPVNYQQQQQQQLDRAATGGAGRPASPGLLLQQQQQQQQQQGCVDPGGTANVRRSYSSPSMSAGAAAAAAAAGNNGSWRDSPSEWSTTPSHPTRWGPQHQQQHQQQQQQQPGIPPPMPPPLPPGQQQPTVGGITGGGWHSIHQQQQQQQQWGQRAPPPAGPPGPMPPSAPHPSSLTGGQQQQQPWQQQQQHHLPLQQGASPAAHGLPPGAAAALARAGSAGAGSPASLQQPFQQQQQQQQQGRVLWQGSIVKQSVHMCGVACLHPGSSSSSSSMLTSAPEPRGWPDALHVNFRICVGDALEQYAASAPDARAVRLLLPLSPDGGDATALQSFINYLNGKDRAGMVKLPPLREHGLGPRAVYLIPPKPGVCQQLQVGWDGRAAMLIAVVVPQPSAAGGGPGGSGGGSAHRGYR